MSWWIQQGTVGIIAFWGVKNISFLSVSLRWSVSFWVRSLKVLFWPRILELHGVTFWYWLCFVGLHAPPHVCFVCVCVCRGEKERNVQHSKGHSGRLFHNYLHYSCQSALLKAKWAKWIFCCGTNVIWKAGLCADSLWAVTQRWRECEELSSSSLHLLLSPWLTLLYTAAKTPPDKTLT